LRDETAAEGLGNWQRIGGLVVFCLFGLVAFLFRLPTFTRSVIDWDESLYFLVAEQWRAGHPPYTSVFDNKPLGIHAAFAALQAIFGDQIVAIRVGAILAVTATAWLVYRVARHLLREHASAAFPVLAGLLYVIGSVLNGGMASNTELFASPFTCAALLAALRARERATRSQLAPFAAGLLIGLAILVRPYSALEGGAIYLVFTLGNDPSRFSWIRAFLLLAAGAILPAALVIAWYAVIGQLDALVDAVVTGNLIRVGAPFSLAAAIRAIGRQAELAPLYLGAAALIVEAAPTLLHRWGQLNWADNDGALVIMAWLFCSIIGVVGGKTFYDHYFLQLLPALCIATSWTLARHIPMAGPPRVLLLAFVVLGVASSAAVVAHDTLRPALHAAGTGIGPMKDTPAQIAALIAPDLARTPSAFVWVFDYEPVIYSLLHAPPPTKYVGPFLFDKEMAAIPRIDARREAAMVLERAPLFVVRSADPNGPAGTANRLDGVYALVDHELAKHYAVAWVFPKAIVYRRQ
jgi:4-amino-4-deoxy-L-arabinose transferase-like glycosyltransferase